MFFFLLEDLFDEVARRRIVIAKPTDDLRIGFNGDSFGNQILAIISLR
jgi:hypothetical protein